jgi:hypothetical protein
VITRYFKDAAAGPDGFTTGSMLDATGLFAGLAQVSVEFVQSGFDYSEFFLFGPQLLLGLDFCRLMLL